MTTSTAKKTKTTSPCGDPSFRGRVLDLPNILTYLRIAAIPMIIVCFLCLAPPLSNWLSFLIFIAVAVTDFLDGYFARVWAQQSRLGYMLDPIADKMLVSVCLLMLTEQNIISGWSTWAAAVILCREILLSGLREFLSEIQVSLPVTLLSKLKTTLQFIAIGILLSGHVLSGNAISVGLTCLWISAVVSLYTGYDYLRASMRYLMEEEA
ncbi:MAG: CDP-diacylglycerol--glycerol-3-phosphate 3-phosphatidyltransferase [Alphaproteobacteria bacterium]|nr:CDP-diacylglycerol--glycerol-3-phosphate 3-phosphatidyltransferase [Alphaproteobacteria bacterium]